MNRCGSSRGGGAAREVEPDRCPLAGVDFLGAIAVELGMQISKKNKKRDRKRKTQQKFAWREK